MVEENNIYEPDLAETERNLGEFYRMFNQINKAEQYFRLSFELYKRLAENDPQQFEPILASLAGDIAVFNNFNNMTMGVEKYYFLSVDIYERLAKRDSVQFRLDLAKALDNLGGYYESKKQLEEANTSYSRALAMLQNILLNKQLDYFDEYDPIVREYKLVFARMNDLYPPNTPTYYTTILELHQTLAKSIEILRGINRNWENDALQEYATISRIALFSKNFSLSEETARRMNELDKGTKRSSCYLANALLFQGKDEEAKKEYLMLVNTKIDWNKTWREMILEDLDILENIGLDKTKLDQARKWVSE